MRRLLTTPLIGVATVAALLGGATSASAEARVITGAYGYYDPNKHMFGIGDTEADGRGVHVDWKVNGISRPRLWNKNGNGSWRDVYTHAGHHGFPMVWKICREGGRCSDWVNERA
ncbi:hypothetical protein E2C00_01095 [Streptomyces sp. WAC05374]|uniref:hypothetical protein n=1 Tax=Streptomyces sp. WAC05374 TaxID=2487420 RepID=UPI000F8987A1|nr:hypothetical protein [Streptomyces sp. WAC05374]RST16376.1 hypothetical protein EF905_12575 [Streptomyces sp. WAC05374]TDF50142.1 hypothetical protein E2B92_01070 [Streptomyces sp. WAC05374]TDF57867.1 hypothetical protein E2C02_08860 [Streptomyces sp. WAC05374]TDF60396.1 hypothetical protein E2C00_01095 [Streptomyces sp. WAC05374]